MTMLPMEEQTLVVLQELLEVLLHTQLLVLVQLTQGLVKVVEGAQEPVHVVVHVVVQRVFLTMTKMN